MLEIKTKIHEHFFMVKLKLNVQTLTWLGLREIKQIN